MAHVKMPFAGDVGSNITEYNYFASLNAAHTFTENLSVAYIFDAGGAGTYTGSGTREEKATGLGQAGGLYIYEYHNISKNDTYTPLAVSVGSSGYTRTFSGIVGKIK